MLTKEGRVQLKASYMSTYLAPFGYYPDPLTHNLWTHETKKICLCVDHFGVEIFSNDDFNHLINALE